MTIINDPAGPERRVVVAGGSGLIGRELVTSLLADGWRVDVLTRNPRRAGRRLPPGVRAVPWSGPASDTTALAAALAGADAVVNLSGVPVAPIPWTARRRRAILGSRVGSTNAIVDAIRALPQDRRPGVLVNASGTDMYTGRDSQPADETTPPATDFLGDVCVQWEAAARAAEPLGVRVVMIRTAVVLARGATYLRFVALPFRLFLGGRIGSGRQWVSWVHIDDLVGLYRAALTNADLRGPVNATAPEPARERDVARGIGRALHRPNWLPVPAWVLRLVLREEAVLPLGSRRAVPSVAQSIGYVFRWSDLDAALADVL
jgi:uncharacterized protein (TIGR01777 family)